MIFQSTPPLWVVTLVALTIPFFYKISIHTTLVGGDRSIGQTLIALRDISIHTTLVGGDRI